ncbi:MAG: hypothetical protein PVF51_01150 [Nitrospirota bacterium]|jgi:hypothetical protein
MTRIPRIVGIAALVVLAIVAVVRNVIFFGGYGDDRARHTVVSHGSPIKMVTSTTTSGIPATGNADDSAAAVPPEQRLMALLRKSPLVKAVPAVTRDPFHLPPSPPARPVDSITARSISKEPELRVLLTSDRRQVAMIDEHIVVPGDRLGDRKVAEITVDGLCLVGQDGETDVELPSLPADLGDDDLP